MIVIGAGRIGTGLKAAAEARGLHLTLVDRKSGWQALDAEPGVPLVLAVRNDDLRDVLARVPPHRTVDVVFVQNGAIREFLAEHGFVHPTRGILYVLAARRGMPPFAGGTNVFTGPHAETLAATFRELLLPSKDVGAAKFAEHEFEKLLWLACNGLLCDIHGAAVGTVSTAHRDALVGLVSELAPVGRAAWGVAADEDLLVDRLTAYSRSIPEYRASCKEWPWRNGWIQAQARAHELATPLHDGLLEGRVTGS